MATDKVKKPRKPRKKAALTTNRKAIKRSIVTSAKVLYKDKIQLYELPTLEHIDESELNKISIDTSVTGSTKSVISSIGTPLYRFSGLTGADLSSDVPYLLDEAAAKRYHTKFNDLSAIDLRLFSDYDQQGIKNTYFNDHPYVVNDNDINSLEYEQLLTKNNLDEAERYFSNRFLNSGNKLKTFNWETDKSYVKSSDGMMTQEVSGLHDLLDLDKWDSQATYKFEWGTDNRTTNTVDLNINAAYYYSVIGIVSVKSIIPDQKSGTIYLEAKPRDIADIDDNWIVVDSAVFKFDQDNKNVGTYITLSGYMSPKYVTRLKLNLHPNAYSMNNWEYRETGSITNHYSNTFVGSAYILDDVISSDTIEMPVDIKFTDSNYKLYKSDNTSIIIDLSATDLTSHFEDSQVYTIPVLDVVNAITACNANVKNLDISTSTQQNRRNFAINGLRYSKTGKIYPITGNMNLYSNCVLYPSYSSGTIEVQEQSLPKITSISAIGEAWQNGQVLYNLNMDRLSALPSTDWPLNTEIYGNHELSGNIEMVNSSTSFSSSTYETIQTSRLIQFSPNTISSYATYKPRRDNHLDTKKIDFSRVLQNYDVVGDITCYITATPRTYGGGSGSESWGRIRYGFTTAAQLNDNNTSASSTIVSPVRLKTKNINRWITNKMCTGSRWNVHSGTLTTHFTQSSRYKQIWIQACADTGKGDSKPTNFSVTVTAAIKFKYRTTGTSLIESTTSDVITSEFKLMTTGTKENIVENSHIYPTLSDSRSITAGTTPLVENTFRVDSLTAVCKFRNNELSVVPYPQNT